MSRLENWFVTKNTSCLDPYKAPEQGRTVLCGEVYDDDRFDDGYKVTTSRLISLSVSEHKAKTKHTEYSLGTVSEDWLKWLDENGYKLEDFNKKEI